MNFKEYSFRPDIRVCVYNVGNENLEYHRHEHISDMTYCAAGELILELPEVKKSFIFRVGQIVQVPYNTVHRVSHFSKSVERSRYVLVQIGKFSIDFVHDNTFAYGENQTDIGGRKLEYFIGENRERLEQIASEFKRHRPADLSTSEYADVLAALEIICSDGIPRSHTNDMIMEQFKTLECT
jgi:hypothetical protein